MQTIFKNKFTKTKSRKSTIITIVAFVIILGLEIFLLWDDIVEALKQQFILDNQQISLVSIGIVLVIGILVLLWFRTPTKKIFGEGKGVKRSTFHSMSNYFLILFFLVPFEFFFLKGSLLSESNDYLSGLSIIGVSIALTGISIAATHTPQIESSNRQELICVGQKFIVTAIFVSIATVSIYMIDNGLNGINANVINASNPINYYRGILFWTAASCFHIGFILFIVGLDDLIFAFYHLDTRPGRHNYFY